MGRLDGKTAIVTGAGQGIGRGIARRFAAEGAAVVIAERDAVSGRTAAALFLASDDAGYATGNTIYADGGSHINGLAWAPDLPD